MPTDMQLPDGRWVPAPEVPFFRDTRPLYVRLWHAVLNCCGYDYDDLVEPWYVPMEMPDRLDNVRG